MNEFDQEYLRLSRNVLENGTPILNERTGKTCIKTFGNMMKFDLSTGKFPLLTLRKLHTKGIFGELLGFIRAVDNAYDFRALGCNFWDANANKSKHWLENGNRKGQDDLGRIYGVQARKWKKYEWSWRDDSPNPGYEVEYIDQLKMCIDKISKNIDDRRLIVTHWNPADFDKMALPPCHMQYQFSIRNEYLDMMMYQRSADVPLGVPSNIASYALFLRIIAQITGKTAGVFTHMLGDTHFYEDQVEGMKELVSREPFDPPILTLNSDIRTLKDLETWVRVDDFNLYNYNYHSAIKFPFSE